MYVWEVLPPGIASSGRPAQGDQSKGVCVCIYIYIHTRLHTYVMHPLGPCTRRHQSYPHENYRVPISIYICIMKQDGASANDADTCSEGLTPVAECRSKKRHN